MDSRAYRSGCYSLIVSLCYFSAPLLPNTQLLLYVGPLHYGVLPKKKVPSARTPGGALYAGAATPTSTQTRLG
jgi:hypothetical protein